MTGIKKMAELRLICEFSLEGAYVMAIVIFSLAVIMKHAYRMRDDVVIAYETSKACVDGAYTEDLWLRENGAKMAGERATARLHAVSRLKGQTISVEKEGSILEKLTGTKAVALCTKDERKIEISIRDPENYMRAISLLEVFK